MLSKSINQFVDTQNLMPEGSSLVLGLSGGPDSVFLLHYLVQLKKQGHISDLIAAHLDHEWRTESKNDVEFCKKICADLNVPFETSTLSAYTNKLKYDGSKEEMARNARRLFFEEIRKKYNADLIALAHHAQDQEETFFIRLIRGSSLSGLTSIWPKQGVYIRPLLQTNKADIVAYLDQHTIPYLTDPTNVSPEFLRNRIRATVLPALRTCDTRFDKNFLATITRLQETELYLQQHTESLFKELFLDNTIDIKKLLAHPAIMQYRLLIQWLCTTSISFPPTQSFLDEIIRFLRQPESKNHSIHPSWQIIKKKNFARIDTR